MADKVFSGARGGKLALKGVAPGPSGGVKKRKKAVESEAPEPVPEVAGIGGEVGAAKPNKTYEELFPSELKRMAESKGRTSAWGSNVRAAPAVLHGYASALAPGGPRTAEERLDQRSAQKADKFCNHDVAWRHVTTLTPDDTDYA